MNLFDVYPINDIEIVKGSGSLIWDNKGVEYLDMYGGHAVISIGHSHPHYISAITAQINKIGFYSNSIKIPLQEELASRLGNISGKDDYQLFLVNSGAEANENALKLASFYNGRKRIIAFKGAFHGRTSLAVEATDNPKIIAPVNQNEHVTFLPFNDVIALEETFAAIGDEICAVIVEGIQGVGGIRVADDAFLQSIRTLCDKHNTVFIADSVQCGYGRTGKFYAHDFSGIKADIYPMAKGMGNGFPVGAIAIAPKFKPWHGMLGTTFGGNHLACAAGIAVLEVIAQENLLENATKIGNYLMDELQKFDEITELRGRGLMIGIELPEQLAHVRKDLLWKHQIFTGEAKPNVIRLLPALNLSQQHADRFLEAFEKTIKE
jgi:acetylornithine/N-succinyldiaminopimelate aminotransferase